MRSRGGAMVLVDQAAEQIPSANVARTDRHRVPRLGSWRGEAEGAMGSPAVVVIDIGPERPIEMPATEDEGPGGRTLRGASSTNGESASGAASGSQARHGPTCREALPDVARRPPRTLARAGAPPATVPIVRPADVSDVHVADVLARHADRRDREMAATVPRPLRTSQRRCGAAGTEPSPGPSGRRRCAWCRPASAPRCREWRGARPRPR